jgi:protein ImuB
VRWQLDGWVTSASDGDQAYDTTTGGLTMLRLVPDEVVPDVGRQLSLWGMSLRGSDFSGIGDIEQVERALARVQGLLGPDAVVTAVVGGGREPREQVRLVPWGEPREALPGDSCPWPGRLPSPSPATVLALPRAAAVTAVDGSVVEVDERLAVSAAPGFLRVESRAPVEIVGWAGPWPLEVRWWDDAAARKRARFQVTTADGAAWLVAFEAGGWLVDACYD